MKIMSLLLQYLVSAASLLLVVWHFLKKRSEAGKGPKAPPGPWGLPIIGHLHLLGSLPHRSLQELAKRYGALMSLRFGMVNVVVASSPGMAREVLKTNDAVLASRPYRLYGEYILYNCADVALAPYGEYWREMRKLCTTKLLTVKSVDSFSPIRAEELSLLITGILGRTKKKQVIHARQLVYELGFNVITRALMSKRYFGQGATADSKEAQQFKSVTEEMIHFAGSSSVGEIIPALKWLDWNIPRLKKFHRTLDQFLQAVVDEHRSRNWVQSGTTQDFLDMMLSYFADEEDHPEKLDNSLKAIMIDLLIGGTDTSSTVIEWAMAELLNHPNKVKKLQEELDRVIGRERLVGESDLPKLDYLNAIVKETFRLHPPLLLLLPHFSMEACIVAGYAIPKGANVLVNVHAIGRDPSVWDMPEQFTPERFLGKTIDVLGHDFELLPFGSGRRACPGMSMGLRTVHLVLSNLMHCFDWSLPAGIDHHPTTERFGIVNYVATPVQAMAWPRLPAHVYEAC